MTIIIPTVAEDLQQLKETVQSAYRLEPLELLLVTPDSKVKRVYHMVEELGSPNCAEQFRRSRQRSHFYSTTMSGFRRSSINGFWRPSKTRVLEALARISNFVDPTVRVSGNFLVLYIL
jgi:hypothetical protein